ncbi:unnamed protein product, partial [Prorocentrum cordatum]
ARWLMGKLQRRIQLFKRPATKLATLDPECDAPELVTWAASAINSMGKVGGHSPFENVLGVAGRPRSSDPFAIVDGGAGETQARNWACQTWEASDFAHVWRDGKGRENRPGKKGGWHGPARVLAQEKRRVDGWARAPSVVWIAHGNTLIWCAPEQLRPASEAEKMITELKKQANLDKTMTDILENAKVGTFEDLVDQRALRHGRSLNLKQNQATSAKKVETRTLEHQQTEGHQRDRLKLSYLLPQNQPLPSQTTIGPRLDLYRPPEKRQMGNDDMDEKTVYFEYIKKQGSEKPDSKGLMDTMLNSFIANQRHKDKLELSLSKMKCAERKEFEEVKVAVDIIRARWHFTRKADGRAKARLARPRRARNVMLTIAAAINWKLIKGDVTLAFLQAHELDKDLFIEPGSVLRKAFNVKGGELLGAVKPGYGTGEAPRHWWEAVKVGPKKLGLHACELEPCMWKLRCSQTGRLIGMAMAHVGDFIVAGDNERPEWNQLVAHIRRLYKWGAWEDMNDGVASAEQCGAITIEENGKGFFLRQRADADNIQEVRPPDGGRHRPPDSLRDKDQTVLRAICGEIYWLGVNAMSFLLAWVAELQSKMPNGTRSLFTTANNIVMLSRQNQYMGLEIHRHSLDDLGGCVAAIAAAKAMEGEKSQSTALDWGSKKLRMVARSSLAAEAQEAGDAKGEPRMVRMVLAEILLNRSPVRGRMAMLHHIPAVLVTDCAASRDGVVRSQSAGLGLEERRAAIEALAPRGAHDEGQATVRRVRLHAQIADGLAQGSWQAFGVLKLFLEKQEWRLICDENFMGARKRAVLGKGIFNATKPEDAAAAREIFEKRRRARKELSQN